MPDGETLTAPFASRIVVPPIVSVPGRLSSSSVLTFRVLVVEDPELTVIPLKFAVVPPMDWGAPPPKVTVPAVGATDASADTLSSEGAIGCQPDGTVVRQAAFPTEEVERLGGGDAFAAGFLYGYLTTSDAAQRLPLALRWGTAAAALKYTIPGDAPLIDRHEIETLLQQGGKDAGLQR